MKGSLKTLINKRRDLNTYSHETLRDCFNQEIEYYLKYIKEGKRK